MRSYITCITCLLSATCPRQPHHTCTSAPQPPHMLTHIPPTGHPSGGALQPAAAVALPVAPSTFWLPHPGPRDGRVRWWWWGGGTHRNSHPQPPRWVQPPPQKNPTWRPPPLHQHPHTFSRSVYPGRWMTSSLSIRAGGMSDALQVAHTGRYKHGVSTHTNLHTST
jgi:hypothetical protein